MKSLTVAVVMLALTGCAMPYAVDDRISYKTASIVRNDVGVQKRIQLVVDDSLRKFILVQRPSSFTGGGVDTVINVGETLSAYIDQLYDKVYVLEPPQDIRVLIKMKESKADFKGSGYASFAFKGYMLDYFLLDTALEVDYQTNSKKFSKSYRYKSDRELSTQEIDTLNKDAAIKIVLEDIAQHLVKDIAQETKSLQ